MKLTERKLRSIIRMVLKEAYDDENNENNENDDIFKFIIKVLNKDIDFGPDFDYSFRLGLDADRVGNEIDIDYIETERGAGTWFPSSLRVDKETISKLRDCFDKNNESMAKQVVLNLTKNEITKNAKLKKTF